MLVIDCYWIFCFRLKTTCIGSLSPRMSRLSLKANLDGVLALETISYLWSSLMRVSLISSTAKRIPFLLKSISSSWNIKTALTHDLFITNACSGSNTERHVGLFVNTRLFKTERIELVRIDLSPVFRIEVQAHHVDGGNQTLGKLDAFNLGGFDAASIYHSKFFFQNNILSFKILNMMKTSTRFR